MSKIINTWSGYPRSKGVILYKDVRGRTHWKLYPDSKNDEERTKIVYNLLTNPKINNSSILMIPSIGVMCGGIWIDNKVHEDGRADMYDLYHGFDMKCVSEKVSTEIEEEIKDANFKSRSNFGFIRPDGKHFGCEYQGHSNLAHDICYGTIDTNNPERYLEEHGWCKVMLGHGVRKYFIYLNDKFKITKEQFATIQKLGLESADGVNEILSRG